MNPYNGAMGDSAYITFDGLGDFQSRFGSIQHLWNSIYIFQFRKFLDTYGCQEDSINQDSASRYCKAALDAARYGLKYIVINLQHIYDWPDGIRLALFIQKNFLPLWRLLDKQVDQFVKDTLRRYLEQSNAAPWSSAVNVSELTQLEKEAEDTQVSDSHQRSPRFSQNMTTFDRISFYALFTFAAPSYSIRQLRCDILGEFITLRGTTTRLSDVKPELRQASFECALCHMIVDGVEQQFKYTEPQSCTNPQCKNRTSWILCAESCQFSDWQKMRLQENSSEIPAGSMPRVIEVIFTRALCDRCKPGDKLLVSGCLAAVPDVPSLMKPGDVPRSVALDRNRVTQRTDMGGLDQGVTGLRKLGVRDLHYRLVFFALDVQTANAGLNFVEEGNHEESTDDWITIKHRSSEPIEVVMAAMGVDENLQKMFFEIANAPDTLDRLAASIAPEVFGCEAVKKAILTLLVGGVEKHTDKDHMKLRGDINICIIGDPGTAKSQILKYVHKFAGRSVYAAGNTSTAAGLTVSIHKDPDQADVVIEAGALMLSDKGVCCIDEFDKMDGKDMVAIHEAMEQQTISICKAGIQATLNARASILAACNPRNGRYDVSKPFRHNIRLSAPVLSRFDLFCTILDNVDRDALVARHVVNLHMGDLSRATIEESHGYPLLNKDALRTYLSLGRSRRPRITAASKKILVESYVAMRAESTQSYHRSPARVTVRQLESLIRLSEAIAKLKFSSVVLPSHVIEARKLIYTCLLRVEKGTVVLDDDSGDEHEDEEEQGSQEGNGAHSTATHAPLGASKKKTQCPSNMDADEFERIAGTLIDHLRSVELELKEDDPVEQKPLNAVEAVVAKDDLITWYIENCTDLTLSQQHLEKEFLKINKVIHRMVNRDFTLIEEERDMHVGSADDPASTHIERVVALRLHPNLALDHSTVYDTHTVPHATLPTSFFDQDHQPELSANETQDQRQPDATWVVNDNDFIDYMYGWNET